jgi:hypothetical protein
VTTSTIPSTTTTSKQTSPGVSVVPVAGPPGTELIVSGTGCLGVDGVNVELRDGRGRAVDGSGGAALPDGTWVIPLRIPQVAAGHYTVHAACVQGNAVTFDYTDAGFEIV